jgi:hypothetical protein
MYWGDFLPMAALSVVLFLVGQNYRGGTIFAAVALILINLATGLVPNSVAIMGAVLALVLLVVVRRITSRPATTTRISRAHESGILNKAYLNCS